MRWLTNLSIYMVALGSSAILYQPIFSQVNTDVPIATYYMECNYSTPSSPLELLGTADCHVQMITQGQIGRTLKLNSQTLQYSVIDEDDYELNTWYTPSIAALGKNQFVERLAIARPSEVRVISINPENSSLTFAYKTNSVLELWTWVLNPYDSRSLPKETMILDLIAGKAAERKFIEFLSINDGLQFEESRITELIDEWINRNVAPKIIAILPNRCFWNVPIRPDSSNCLERYANSARQLFEPLDPTGSQPLCMVEALANTTSPEQFHMLVRVGNNYEVWTADQGTPPTIATLYGELVDFINPDDRKFFAWLTIVCYGCNSTKLAEFNTDNGRQVYVFSCADYIMATSPTDTGLATFAPIDLVDKKRQSEFIRILNNGNNYKNSLVSALVKTWAENPSSENKMVIKAFAQKEAYNYEGGRGGIVTSLKATLNPKEANIALVIRLSDSTFQITDGQNYQLSWYNRVSNSNNAWLAQLATVDPNVSVIKNDMDYTAFVISKPKNELWAWKSVTNSEPNEFNPLAHLYDDTHNKSLRTAYARAFRRYTTYLDKKIDRLIKNYFQGGTIQTLRQIYPAQFKIPKPYSPYKLFGAINEFSTIPAVLKLALESGLPLNYLVERSENKFEIYNSSEIISASDVWFGKVSFYKNTWLAWLCLADPEISVIATENHESALKVCMVSSNDRGNLWSWVDARSRSVIPKQFKLIDGTKTMGLTKAFLSLYVESLRDGGASLAEKRFLLKVADRPKSFVLMDNLIYGDNPRRLLFWRHPDSTDQRLFRVANDVRPGPIKINLVYEGVNEIKPPFDWKEVANRYSNNQRGTRWCRNHIKNRIARASRASKKQLAAWFGEARLGLAKGEVVGVFLPPGFRNFGFMKLTDLNPVINDNSDKAFIPSGIPDLVTLFDAWVRERWQDTQVWRANPLGYFDRARTLLHQSDNNGK